MTEEKKTEKQDEAISSENFAEVEIDAEEGSETIDLVEKDTPEGQVDLDDNKEIIAGIREDDFDQLTKKNQQFMISLDRHIHDEFNHQVRGQLYEEIVDTLIAGQAHSQTAKQIYGTPTELAQTIRDQELGPLEEEDQEVSSDLLLAIDGSLFLGSLFTFVTGMSMVLSKNPADQDSYMGVLTMILNYLVAGLAMLLTAKNLPKPDAPKGQKGYGKYFFISVVSMALWFLVVSFSVVILPRVINPILPAIVYMIIGASTFALRFYLRRKYNIKGGVF